MEKLSGALNECENLSANDKQLLYAACEKAEQAYSLFDSDLYYQGEVYLIAGKDSCIMFSVEMCYDRVAKVQTIKGR